MLLSPRCCDDPGQSSINQSCITERVNQASVFFSMTPSGQNRRRSIHKGESLVLSIKCYNDAAPSAAKPLLEDAVAEIEPQ